MAEVVEGGGGRDIRQGVLAGADDGAGLVEGPRVEGDGGVRAAGVLRPATYQTWGSSKKVPVWLHAKCTAGAAAGAARLVSVPLPVGCLSWLLHPVSVTATTMKAADRPMMRLT